MSFGAPQAQSAKQVLPPQRGSFPLDHDGECKSVMADYLACIKQHRGDNEVCRVLAKEYLRCRMDKGLMANDDFENLGFHEGAGAGAPKQPCQLEASPQSIRRVVVFGDSLSDNGNGTYKLTGERFPSTPYFEGRFSNGPVWVDYLANALAVPVSSYAHGGATVLGAGEAGMPGVQVPSIRDQVQAFLQQNQSLSDSAATLYIVWGGLNDLQYDLQRLITPGQHDVLSRFPVQVAQQVGQVAQTLVDSGAGAVAVFNLPDPSAAPLLRRYPATHRAASSSLVLDFNRQLKEAVPQGVKVIDVHTLFAAAVDQLDKHGLQNVAESCLAGYYSTCRDAHTYMFWDDVHPTTRSHEILAQNLVDAMRSMLT
ncbi:hypothetical protein RI367_001440 [Sorochytrium milnesiophthora]